MPPPPDGPSIPGAHQGGDSRWALTQPSVDPVSARLMTDPPVSTAEGGTAPTERPSGSSGHVLGEVPRYGICAASLPEAEGRVEAAAAQIQRGARITWVYRRRPSILPRRRVRTPPRRLRINTFLAPDRSLIKIGNLRTTTLTS